MPGRPLLTVAKVLPCYFQEIKCVCYHNLLLFKQDKRVPAGLYFRQGPALVCFARLFNIRS